MANAKKCDRCGTYYDRNHGKTYHGEYISKIRFSSDHKSFDDVDLCDDCVTFLMDWLFEPYKNKED